MEEQPINEVNKPLSREERREIRESQKLSEEESEHSRTDKKVKKLKVRLIPIWLRLLLVLVFCAASLAAGLAIGYGVIGDGNPSDIFEKATWQHIVDIVVKEK